MDDRYSARDQAGPGTTSGVVPDDTRYVEHTIAGVRFRFTRRITSDFVSILRLGVRPAPEIFAYAANLDTENPVYKRFHGWHSTQDELSKLWSYAVTLHQSVRERDEQPAVTGHGSS